MEAAISIWNWVNKSFLESLTGWPKSLENLLEQQRQEEEARQEAARQIQDFNRANQRGGYQAEYSDDFMEGPTDPGADLTSTMGST